ncbi:MAG TPA: recombination protein O N-terminal domain-containing protein, partial [Tissierellaceae bacterium]
MVQAKGIVLNEIRFQETSKILNIYTLELGKINVMAKGAYRPKSKIIAQTQP